MRAASRVPTVLGLTGLLAALAFLGGNAGTVMAALNAETTNTVSATGATWSIVVNGTPGAKSLSLPASGSGCTSFTLNNNGNVNMSSATVTASVTVTNVANFRTYLYPNGTCTNSGRVSLNANQVFPVPKTTTWVRPTTTTPSTWSFNRRDTGTACTVASPGCRVTITVTVSSADIAAGTATNG